MASTVVDISNAPDGRPIHDVQFMHTVTKKLVTVPMLSDTGQSNTRLDLRYARMLGINNLESSPRTVSVSSSLGGGSTRVPVHDLMMKIGNLKPIKISVTFSNTFNTKEQLPNILGLSCGLFQDCIYDYYNIYFSKNSIRYEEVVKPVPKTSAYVYAMYSQGLRNYRTRI